MRGLVFDGVGSISYRTDLPDPEISARTDAIVAVERAGLCGSDLHPYEGREPAGSGIVAGHEVVGHVVAVGSRAARIPTGARVVVPFTTSCGSCPACRRGLTARCELGQLFGWGPPGGRSTPHAFGDVEYDLQGGHDQHDLQGGHDQHDRPDEQALPGLDVAPLHGGQAELLRVPHADTTMVPIPDAVDAATALLLTDNLPTAWEALARSQALPGDPLVVVGLGSVGLCVVALAVQQGVGPVLGIDPVLDRRSRAERLGATATAPPDRASEALTEVLPNATAGSLPLNDLRHTDLHQGGLHHREGNEGSPAVIEAAGTDAAQRLAFELLRPGGNLSIISVQTGTGFAFTPAEAYDRNLTVHAGRASVRPTISLLLPSLLDGSLQSPAESIVTHQRAPLSDGADLYRRFAGREEGLVKAAFDPSITRPAT